MSVSTNDENEFFNMSDDDFAKISEPSYDESELAVEEDTIEGDDSVEEEAQDESIEESEVIKETEEESDEPEEELPSTEDEPDETIESEELGEEDNPEDSDDEDADEEPEDDTSEKTDAEKQLEKLFSPFKANGKELKVDSVDDAIQLMQMGANYSKKMAALKPKVKLLKMLENNDLLDESKLSFYIDVSKGNKEAVATLLKQLEVDPLEVDLDKSEDYTPGTYNVSDNEVEVSRILDEIKDTPTYNRTLGVVSNKWDESSRSLLVQNPVLIKVINDHMESGVFDKITSEIERERMLGRLDGVSDLEAYKVIGDKLYSQPSAQPEQQEGKVVQRTKPKAKDDSKLKSRKKVASPVKATPSSKKTDDDFNPLSLSDEEFEKIAANNIR